MTFWFALCSCVLGIASVAAVWFPIWHEKFKRWQVQRLKTDKPLLEPGDLVEVWSMAPAPNDRIVLMFLGWNEDFSEIRFVGKSLLTLMFFRHHCPDNIIERYMDEHRFDPNPYIRNLVRWYVRLHQLDSEFNLDNFKKRLSKLERMEPDPRKMQHAAAFGFRVSYEEFEARWKS